MIDLIIPYYNNPEALQKTLKSVNAEVFYTTVVDDGSSIYLPCNIAANQAFRYNDNRGPGRARQLGIDKTSNPYIMFIDAGDVFLSNGVQQQIADTVAADPITNVFYWTYYYKDKETNFLDNRLHGKVYKREFLNKYNITFCKEGSYMNEDIGFNRTCRIITNFIKIPIKHTEMPVIKWIADANSLTQKDSCAALYKDQCQALSINSIHSIETCRKIVENNIKEEINEIALSLYYWFVRCAAQRPEYLSEAWKGTKIFYDKYSSEIDIKQLAIGSTKLKQCLQYRSQIHFPVNIIRFARDMINYKELPQWYK